MGDGGVDLHGFQGLLLLLGRGLVLHGAHVVEPVGYLDVTRYSNGMIYTDSYYDFDSTYCSNLWNKFLYTQFTHEYYQAYKGHLMEEVERKLTNMIKI